VESEPELLLEDASHLRGAMRHMVRYASDATDALDGRIEDEDLDGKTEAVEVREALATASDVTTGGSTARRRSGTSSTIGWGCARR